MGAHSLISPSSAAIWAGQGCTAYPLMAATYPEVEGDEARDGTHAHEIAECIIDAHAHARDSLSRDFKCSEEQLEAAKMFADDVAAVMQKSKVFGGEYLGVEQRVTCAGIHPQSFGTCDCFLYDRVNGVLYIWDFKYGYGLVEVFENWQLINYAAGLLELFEIDGMADQHLRVVMRVVQPRGFHPDGPIREWSCMASDLRSYKNVLRDKAAEAFSDAKQCKSGPKCRYCPARHACSTALAAGVQLYEAAAAPAPVELTPEALGVQLGIVKRARAQMEYLETGYEEQVRSLQRGGKRVPGWDVEPSKGREIWAKDKAAVEAMGKTFAVDLTKGDVLTPNQARAAGIPADVVKAFSETPTTGTKLVADNGSKARQIFGAR